MRLSISALELRFHSASGSTRMTTVGPLSHRTTACRSVTSGLLHQAMLTDRTSRTVQVHAAPGGDVRILQKIFGGIVAEDSAWVWVGMRRGCRRSVSG